jgi:phospholipid/cholesterol/gamma-HCH transport system substrate-binding protein
MRKLTAELRVGLLILGGLVVIVYSSVIVTGWRPGQADTYTVFVDMDNVAGLLVGSPAQVAGIKIGEVSAIELVEDRARISLDIITRYKLYADSQATIKSLGILGDKYVDLIPGSPTQVRLKEGDAVRFVIPGSDLDSLVTSAAVILRDVQAVTGTLRDTLGGEPGRDRFNLLLDQLVAASQNLSRFTVALERVMRENEAALGHTAQNLEQFTDALRRIAGDNERSLGRTAQNFEGFTNTLTRIAGDNERSLGQTVQNLEELSAGLRRIVTDNEGGLQSIVARLDRFSGNIERISSDNEQGIRDTIDSLAQFSRELEAITTQNREALDGIVARLATFSEALATDGPQITGAVRAILEENRAELKSSVTSLDHALANLNVLSEDLRDLSRDNREDFSRIITNLEAFTGDLANRGPRITANLEGIVEENRAELKSSVTSLDRALANLNVLSEDLRGLSRDNREDFSRIIANLESFTGDLANRGPSITSNLDGILQENRTLLRTSVANLDRSFEKLDTTMANLTEVTGKLERGEGSLGKLISDETTVDELNSALSGINKFLTDLNRLKLDVGGHTEYLTGQQEFKSYLTLKLQPLKNRWYVIQLVDNPRGRVTERTIETKTTGTTSEDTTTKEIETTSELQISLLINQRYFDTVVRGGLMESTFGLGVEQIFGADDQYSVGLDIWDFGNDFGPHAKLTAFWRFYSNAFFLVGYDDFLSERREFRDAFFGVGISFNEDSLKPLFSSLPLTSVTGQ